MKPHILTRRGVVSSARRLYEDMETKTDSSVNVPFGQINLSAVHYGSASSEQKQHVSYRKIVVFHPVSNAVKVMKPCQS